jgi:hypothetical protein
MQDGLDLPSNSGAMENTMKDPVATASMPGRWVVNRWVTFGIALLSFAVGSLLTSRIMRVRPVGADRRHVFQLMVYHTVPGKAPALESVFRDVSKLQQKHDLQVVGYWLPTEDSEWKNTFVYLVSHTSRQAGEANWKALHADPAFPPYRRAAEPLIEKVNGEFQVDEVYMRPTEFSAMQ